MAVYLSKQTDESMELTEVWPLTFTILSLTLQASPPTCLTVGRLQLSGGGGESAKRFSNVRRVEIQS